MTLTASGLELGLLPICAKRSSKRPSSSWTVGGERVGERLSMISVAFALTLSRLVPLVISLVVDHGEGLRWCHGDFPGGELSHEAARGMIHGPVMP